VVTTHQFVASVRRAIAGTANEFRHSLLLHQDIVDGRR
jgi:hypothetical protein